MSYSKLVTFATMHVSFEFVSHSIQIFILKQPIFIINMIQRKIDLILKKFSNTIIAFISFSLSLKLIQSLIFYPKLYGNQSKRSLKTISSN